MGLVKDFIFIASQDCYYLASSRLDKEETIGSYLRLGVVWELLFPIPVEKIPNVTACMGWAESEGLTADL